MASYHDLQLPSNSRVSLSLVSFFGLCPLNTDIPSDWLLFLAYTSCWLYCHICTVHTYISIHLSTRPSTHSPKHSFVHRLWSAAVVQISQSSGRKSKMIKTHSCWFRASTGWIFLSGQSEGLSSPTYLTFFSYSRLYFQVMFSLSVHGYFMFPVSEVKFTDLFSLWGPSHQSPLLPCYLARLHIRVTQCDKCPYLWKPDLKVLFQSIMIEQIKCIQYLCRVKIYYFPRIPSQRHSSQTSQY